MSSSEYSSSKSSTSKSSSKRRNAQHKYDVRKLVLSKMKESSSVPSLEEIEKIQIMNFTVEEIKHMCSNKITAGIICKVLNTDPKQLNKFCKYLNTFLENPDKSPANIRDEMIKVKNKTKLSHLPEDAVQLILSKYKEMVPLKMVLRDWVYKQRKKLNWKNLGGNENSIDYMMDNIDKVELYRLPYNKNPKLKDLLNQIFKKRTDTTDIPWSLLSKNEYAIDIIVEELKKPDSKVDWKGLSRNPHPKAIKLIKEELKKPNNRVDWKALSSNPGAIKLIEEELKKPDSKVSWNSLGQNENAMHIIEKEFEKENSRVDWTYITLNKSAIPLITKVLERDPNDIRIMWSSFSFNPNAIDIFKRYPDKIDISQLMHNDSNRVLEIIVKNGRLQNNFIDWVSLADSKHIKYVWDNFREEAINKFRMIFQQEDENIYYSLADNEYGIDVFEYFYENNMIPQEELSHSKLWFILSNNPNAMSILEKNQDKIDWSAISFNPSIFVRDKLE